MRFIQSLFGYPLGFIMWAIYKVIPNYGVALLVFTLFTRVIMFPLAIKQQKSSTKSTLMQPRLKEIQDKYKDDKEKQSEEMQKLYKEEGYSPLSGCLPLLIQMPILFGLIDVVYKPLTHILHLGAELVEKATAIMQTITAGSATPSYYVELDIIKAIKNGSDAFTSLGAATIERIFDINYNFLGMNLMTIPDTSMITGMFSGGFDMVVLIPILSGVTALLMSLISMKTMPQAEGSGGGSMKGMMLVTPLMSIWIAFTVPAGVGLYWIYSNIFAIIQNLYMNHKYNPKELAEQAKKDQEERQIRLKEEKEAERLEAKQLMKEGKLEEKDIEKALTKKEIDRRRLAEARRRDAEKYGEEYVEVSDEDFR